MGSRSDRANEIARKFSSGVSFSLKTCRDYGLNWPEALKALCGIGVKRFRLMAYWDEHEPQPGDIRLDELVKQLAILKRHGAKATVTLGFRQPRWPETHVPEWALELDEAERSAAYTNYQATVVKTLRGNQAVESWQLENEFWNKGFGVGNNFSRSRLKAEFAQLRQLDQDRPIIMSLGNTFGLPLGQPRADIYGVTVYLWQHKKDGYKRTIYPPRHYRVLGWLIKLLTRRPLIIHELQAEPWGPASNQDMTDSEQALSMNADKLLKAVRYADKTGLKYKDLWGAEWWYWRKTKRGDDTIWQAATKVFKD